MKTLKQLCILMVSIVLWVIFITPRLIIISAKLIKSILTIIEKTANHFIETVRVEVLK